MNELINLALRRNLFFPSAEIYANSPSGFYDFGPTGVKIKNNIIDFWRKNLVEQLDGVEIEGSLVLPEKVFEASGHIESFFDPVLKDLDTGVYYRADKLLEEIGIVIGEKTSLDEIDRLVIANKTKLSKHKKGFDKAFRFNMMFDLKVGASDSNIAFLKPEACQNIFLDFKRIYMGARKNLPLPIAQVTKAFRNEVAPRNGLVRLRELSQMDIEVFFNPKKNKFDIEELLDQKLPLKTLESDSDFEFKTVKEWKTLGKLNYDFEIFYISKLYQFFVKMGYKHDMLRFKEVSKDDRPFYSLATWDLEAAVPELGWVEIVANNYRTDYDLSRHQQFSKSKLTINEDNEEFLPHIFEISTGVERTFYCLLAQNLVQRNDLTVLTLNPGIGAYGFAIYPLVSKDGVDDLAKSLYDKIKNKFSVLYDDKGSIGKRYARTDEIGVRYALTVDYQTKEDNTITLRDSWTGLQIRVNLDNIEQEMIMRL